jgi:maleate isomerase
MAYSNWRGVIGMVKPGMTAGAFDEFVRLLPDGIGAIQLFMDLPEERGAGRLQAAFQQLDEKIGRLAAEQVDIIFPEGSAAYMMKGRTAERDLIEYWESKHKTTIAPTGFTLVSAMTAMKFKKIIGIRPFTWQSGADFTKNYFCEAGFDVLEVVSPAGFDHTTIDRITPQNVYRTAKQAVARHQGADGIFILAAIMPSTEIIQAIEDDLGIPVITATTARCWQALTHLRVREPRDGFGRLLKELPQIR